MAELKRFGVSVDEELLEKFDEMIAESYQNRSEAIRDLIREKIIADKCTQADGQVIGVLTLIYNHSENNLPKRMVEIECDYNCLFRSNLHLYLNDNFCLEVIVIQGKLTKIKKVARKLSGLRGVKHSKLNLTTASEQL